MSGVNKAIILGRLTKDPEARDLQSGGKVVSLRVATNETWKDKDGERQERSEFHSVVIFNEKLGEVASKYLRKGSQVYLEGQLQTRKWQKDGQDRWTTEVVLQRFGGALQLVGGRPDGADAGESPDPAAHHRDPGYAREKSQAAPPKGAGGDKWGGGGWARGSLDDDIPF